MEQPNIVFLLLDTARADHFGCYGYDRNTTPNIDALAKRSLVYERAYSSSIWSLPAYASIFNGELPSEHGAVDWNATVPENRLVENLSENGYQTAAVSPHLVSGDFGLADAFDTHVWVASTNQNTMPYPDDEVTEKMRQRAEAGAWENAIEKYLDFLKLVAKAKSHKPFANAFWYVLQRYHEKRGNWEDDGASEILNRSLDILRETDDPVFLFGNFIEPHAPYRPPRDWIYEFVDDDVPITKLNEVLLKSDIEATAGAITITDEERQLLIDLYDAELRYLDDRIGAFVREVERDDEDTVFVIASDHGDLFGEWGAWGHQAKLHPDLARVPLLISYPDRSGDRIRETISLRQLCSHLTEISAGNDDRIAPQEYVISEYFGWDTQLSITPWDEYDRVDPAEFGQYQLAIFGTETQFLYDSTGAIERYDLGSDRAGGGLSEEAADRIVEEVVGDPSHVHEEYRHQQSDNETSEKMKRHLEHLGYM